jgi:Zn-dependent protease
MDGAARLMDKLLYEIALWLVPLVIAIVFHEVAHGWAALAFGDTTARDARRLSLNPLRHVDPVGTVVLPMVLAITGAPIFGWARPVPVRFEKLRHPRVQMIFVALAGPATNFLLALVGALLFSLQIARSEFIQQMLVNFVAVNIFLGLFNLLPLPPFDGGHVVEGLLPRPFARQYRKLGRLALPILIFLLLIMPMIFKVNVVSALLLPPAMWLLRLLLGAPPGL